MRVFAVAVVAVLCFAGCYNTRSVQIPLARNPAGLECHSSCLDQQNSHGDYMTCMAACPGARTGSDKCALVTPPTELCEHSSKLSTIKTLGLTVIGVVLFALALGG